MNGTWQRRFPGCGRSGLWMSEGISYEEYLDRYGTLTYSVVGSSMLPLLRQGKDLFTVTKKGPERCRRGDVVLYRRPPDSYVLHRIIEVRPEDYVILGDNCVNKEYGIKAIPAWTAAIIIPNLTRNDRLKTHTSFMPHILPQNKGLSHM